MMVDHHSKTTQQLASAATAAGTTAPAPQLDARRQEMIGALQAASGTAQVAASMGDLSAGARETGTASSQVFASAQALAKEGAVLKREVETFLASVRAA